MPRYFFNLYDGQDIFDDVWTVLANEQEMQLHMLATARAWIEREEHQHRHWFLEARDDGGEIVGSMRFGVKPDNGTA